MVKNKKKREKNTKKQNKIRELGTKKQGYLIKKGLQVFK